MRILVPLMGTTCSCQVVKMGRKTGLRKSEGVVSVRGEQRGSFSTGLTEMGELIYFKTLKASLLYCYFCICSELHESSKNLRGIKTRMFFPYLR